MHQISFMISRTECQIMDSTQCLQVTPDISELFSFLQAWTCPIASLLFSHTHRNGPGQMVSRILFSFLATLWNEGHRPHAKHNTGPSQHSFKCLIHAKALLSQFFFFKKTAPLMWLLGERTQRIGSVYVLATKVYTFRKPALLDDIGRLLSCRLSSHSPCGKSQHSITHCYTR